MAGGINSYTLGKAAINAGSGRIIPVSAVVRMDLKLVPICSRRTSLTPDFDVSFNIDGASGRHAAFADLGFGFESTAIASRMKAAKPQDMTISFDMACGANQRGVIGANLPIDFGIKGEMQFAHLHRAPHGRVMMIEAEVRSSTLPREGN